MTRDEAKDKWCPMVRLIAISDTGELQDNRWLNHTTTMCLGDQCAWWRWETSPENVEFFKTFKDAKGLPSIEDGYCGKAGKE